MRKFCEQHQCDFDELAWYFHGQAVCPTDRPTLVSHPAAWTSTSIQKTNICQLGIRDGDTLDVSIVSNCLSTDEEEQWMAHLEVTEEKIDHLQTEIDFKRTELEAAARENESDAARISAVRLSICRLRQNISPRIVSGYARR